MPSPVLHTLSPVNVNAIRTCVVSAHAKINLFLEINGRRSDGYHNLISIFQEISLADELKITRQKKPGCLLRCSDAGLSTGADNLVVRAIDAFQNFFQIKKSFGLKVVLKKNIPMGAGLGGGSSDAAAALKACWHIITHKPINEFPEKSFLSVARNLGADVPFFLKGGLARARGIGQILTPIEVRRRVCFWYVLVFPRTAVSTKWVYNKLRFPLTKPRSSRKLKEILLQGGTARACAPFLYNRLEEVVLPRVRVVAQAKKALLQAGCLSALMSGSGSCVFGLAESHEKAKKLADKIKTNKWDVWVVHSL